MNIVRLGPVLSGFASRALLGHRTIFTESWLQFKMTDVLLAEPLKKKRKIDPQIIRSREDRKKRKLEKMIRRLEKAGLAPKPVEENEIPYSIIDEKEIRVRNVVPPSTEELERRTSLFKEWCAYKHQQARRNDELIERIINSQHVALTELWKESKELYEEAVQIDISLLPYTATGPTRTPSIQNYPSPDGEYIDVTKKFDGE